MHCGLSLLHAANVVASVAVVTDCGRFCHGLDLLVMSGTFVGAWLLVEVEGETCSSLSRERTRTLFLIWVDRLKVRTRSITWRVSSWPLWGPAAWRSLYLTHNR